MRDWQSQSHVRRYCKNHVVFVPKHRKKSFYGMLRTDVGNILRGLCVQYEVELVGRHAMPDHIRLCLSVPTKYSVPDTVGFLKGKSAIQIHRKYLGRPKQFMGLHVWARGYCVSTIGFDEQVVRESIRNQEEEEKRQEPLRLKGLQALSWVCDFSAARLMVRGNNSID